jgi:hypothetical protein
MGIIKELLKPVNGLSVRPLEYGIVAYGISKVEAVISQNLYFYRSHGFVQLSLYGWVASGRCSWGQSGHSRCNRLQWFVDMNGSSNGDSLGSLSKWAYLLTRLLSHQLTHHVIDGHRSFGLRLLRGLPALLARYLFRLLRLRFLEGFEDHPTDRHCQIYQLFHGYFF